MSLQISNGDFIQLTANKASLGIAQISNLAGAYGFVIDANYLPSVEGEPRVLLWLFTKYRERIVVFAMRWHVIPTERTYTHSIRCRSSNSLHWVEGRYDTQQMSIGYCPGCGDIGVYHGSEGRWRWYAR